MASAAKNIVLVGGGSANVALASSLEKSLHKLEGYNIILISARDYYYHLIAGLRANTSDEKIAEDICVPLDKLFKDTARSKVIHGEVVDVKSSSVILRDGQEIPFAYLVLATGRKWFAPSDAPDARSAAIEQMKAYRDRVAAAKNIVIVGGGAVGIELAGEIAGSYGKDSGKKVTLVHGQSKLMNDTYNDKFRNSLQKQLVDLGVDVLLDDCIDGEHDFSAGQQEIATRKGNRIQADLVIKATGASVNAAHLQTLVPNLLSPGGVKIKPTFQIEGHDNIFAIGDLADLPEQKQAIKAGGHANVVHSNILASINGQSLTDYQKGKEMIIVNISTIGGAGYFDLPLLGPTVLGPWICKTLKGKSLFVSQIRATLGY